MLFRDQVLPELVMLVLNCEVGSRRHAEELELQKWFDAWIEILSTFISQAPAFANLGFLAKSSLDRVLRQKLECVSFNK